MLPSIQAPTKKLSSPKQKKSKSIKVELIHDKEETSAPFLPFLSEGSFTSLVSSNSTRSRWNEKIKERNEMKPAAMKVKHRGGGFRDHVNQKLPERRCIGDTSFSSVKTHDLQFSYQPTIMANKGWSIQNPNPRLMKLQTNVGKFHADLTPFKFKNVQEYSFFSRTLVAPHIDFLYNQKQAALKDEKAIAADGTTATLNDRFFCPPLNVGENVLDLPGGKLIQTPPSPPQVFSPRRQNESPCAPAKTCGCVHLIERDNISSRSLYNRWERKPSSSRLNTSTSSGMVGSKVRIKQTEKTPPSPPKIPLIKKGREMSLENLRRKVKKAVNQSSSSHDKLNEKTRRSSQSNTLSNKKLKNKRGSKTKENEEARKEEKKDLRHEAKEAEMLGEPSLVTQRDVEPMDIKEDEMVDTISELKQDSDQVIEALTIVESISTSATPTSIRRLATPRILKITYTEEQHDDEFSSLKKTFAKLDSDGDGHLSFDELQRSLPCVLTKRQLDYLKKIYLMACESTFFGFEEFLAVHQMCDVIGHASAPILDAFETIDLNSIEQMLTKYMELFTDLDRKQSGSLDISSFKEFLGVVMNIKNDQHVVIEVLKILGKGNTDVISNVELLVFLPYLVNMTP